MATALDQLTGMPTLPVTSGLMGKMPAAPKGYIGPKEMAPAMEELRGAEAQAVEKVGKADVAIEEAKLAEKATELEQRAALTERLAKEERELSERQALKEARQDLEGMKFVPTRESAQDLAAFFGLIGVIGMVGAKGNALKAMNAMDGMLKGYREGKKEQFRQEQIEFDKNFKAMQAKIQTLEKELTEAMALKVRDREAGELQIQAALAKSESPLLKAMKDKQGDVAVLSAVRGARKDLDTMVNLENKLRADADKRAFQEERMRLQREIQELRAQRQTGAEGKPLKETELKKIEGLDSVADGLEQLKKDFKPSFASLGLLGFGADLSLEAKRRLGDKEGREAVSWWSRYQQLQAPNRHALFGATLTGNELKNYQSFTTKPSDNPEVVKDFLTDQINYTRNVSSGTRRSFESAGYRVPEAKPRDYFSTFQGQTPAFNTVQEAEAANLPKGTEITIGGRKAVVE